MLRIRLDLFQQRLAFLPGSSGSQVAQQEVVLALLL